MPNNVILNSVLSNNSTSFSINDTVACNSTISENVTCNNVLSSDNPTISSKNCKPIISNSIVNKTLGSLSNKKLLPSDKNSVISRLSSISSIDNGSNISKSNIKTITSDKNNIINSINNDNTTLSAISSINSINNDCVNSISSNNSINNKIDKTHNLSNSSKKTELADSTKNINSVNKIENTTILINEHIPIANNKIIIDVAVLCQEYTNVNTMCHDNVINLDEIPITKELFQSIFYPYHENFGLNKEFILNNKEYIFPYISFLPEFRRVFKNKFYLLEEIIANIESDLSISRNCFTKESLVELTNEIINIQSLCDINCCSVLSSLSWNNILEIIKNYKLIKYCTCEKPNCCECKSDIIPICVINIIFKTPTCGVKDTIIRFNYRITDL